MIVDTWRKGSELYLEDHSTDQARGESRWNNAILTTHNWEWYTYGGWKKSCTSWKRGFIPLFAGFQPSVWWCRISQPSTVPSWKTVIWGMVYFCFTRNNHGNQPFGNGISHCDFFRSSQPSRGMILPVHAIHFEINIMTYRTYHTFRIIGKSLDGSVTKKNKR